MTDCLVSCSLAWCVLLDDRAANEVGIESQPYLGNNSGNRNNNKFTRCLARMSLGKRGSSMQLGVTCRPLSRVEVSG